MIVKTRSFPRFAYGSPVGPTVLEKGYCFDCYTENGRPVPACLNKNLILKIFLLCLIITSFVHFQKHNTLCITHAGMNA